MIYIGNGMYSDSGEYLQHYGVLGMKWGQHLFGRARDAYGSARNLYRKGLRRTLNGTRTGRAARYAANNTRTGRAAQRVGRGIRNTNFKNVAKDAARYTGKYGIGLKRGKKKGLIYKNGKPVFDPGKAPVDATLDLVSKAAKRARSRNSITNKVANYVGKKSLTGRAARYVADNSRTSKAAKALARGIKNPDYKKLMKYSSPASAGASAYLNGVSKATKYALNNTRTGRAARYAANNTRTGRAAQALGGGIKRGTRKAARYVANNTRTGRAARSAGKNIRKRVRRL